MQVSRLPTSITRPVTAPVARRDRRCEGPNESEGTWEMSKAPSDNAETLAYLQIVKEDRNNHIFDSDGQ